MTPIKKPTNAKELADALLSVRRDLEARGEIATAPEAVPAPPEKMSEQPVPATPDSQPTTQAPPPAPRAVPLRTAADAPTSATPAAAAGMRPDPYREQIETPEEEQTPAPIPRSPKETESEPSVDAVLMSDEVNDGLAELLAKWDIFEKSGIFGLGPSGMQHPTYEQIAGLPVQAVLSGQWEDADQEVAATIGEYVAGWKAEQGVSPREGETFELYLRRVIASYLGGTEGESQRSA